MKNLKHETSTNIFMLIFKIRDVSWGKILTCPNPVENSACCPTQSNKRKSSYFQALNQLTFFCPALKHPKVMRKFKKVRLSALWRPTSLNKMQNWIHILNHFWKVKSIYLNLRNLSNFDLEVEFSHKIIFITLSNIVSNFFKKFTWWTIW